MKRLIEKIAQMQNPSVVGLDSLLDYIPQHIKDEKFEQYGDSFDAAAQAILEYNKAIIDAICDIVPAIKPQAAYYELYSWQGMWALSETVRYAQSKGMIVIMDGKRNDIGSTMQAYAKAHLGTTALRDQQQAAFGSDMLTVNGYLGSDGIEPLLPICDEKDKGSFDIHTQIWQLHCELDKAAKISGAVSVISAGWDPGSDSVVRALLEACAPKGITDTNFGPGMSMGHSVAAKGKPGVKNALSMTIPLGTGIHRRNVYIELEDGYDFEQVKASILEDDYFKHDETHIFAVPSVDALMDKGHGVNLVRKGVSGTTHNQLFEFNMKINNPALTSQVMVACARASVVQAPGCYVLPQLPMMDLLPGTLEEKIKRLV